VLSHHPVGAPTAWPETVAFLDGIQRYAIVSYLGASPLFVANVAAAVRERRERRLHTAVVERRAIAIGAPDLLESVAGLLGPICPVPLPADVLDHPVRQAQAARREVEHQRARLERLVAAAYRRESRGWLVVDGALSEGIEWSLDPRMIGISKSHSTLPFGGEEQVRYLRTPAGHRTSVFAPQTRSLAPVHSWALRLWPWEGRDLFYGLVRVEMAATDETVRLAPDVSRWLLAERAPISAPDPRWDRLLYGVRDVEVYLAASQPRAS